MAGLQKIRLVLGLLVLVLVAPGWAQPKPDVLAVVGEFDRMARTSLWPSFEPAQVPLLIYDGENTYLVRHPQPPEEFQPLPEHPEVLRFAGRHAAARANSSVEIGGVKAASAIVRAEGAKPRDLAALVMHEAFHVFQGRRHPKWAANEVDFFVYPLEDAELLLLRRLESEALRNALSHGGRKLRACWAAAALKRRRERFSRLGPPASAYERGTELNEGLAQYVEYRARRRPHVEAWPAPEFAPQQVRQRGYASGQALAALLDTFRPGWKEELERGATASLDELLEKRLPAASAASCELPATVQAELRARAEGDVEALRGRNRERREAFLSRPGWRLVVIPAAGAPLFPQAFDPWNVSRLQPGEVLHGRWIKLGNAAGEIEVLDREALTEAAGSHPLFEGVRQLQVSGLEQEPVVEQKDESVTVRAPGVNARFRGARVSHSGETVEIRLAEEEEEEAGGKP